MWKGGHLTGCPLWELWTGRSSRSSENRAVDRKISVRNETSVGAGQGTVPLDSDVGRSIMARLQVLVAHLPRERLLPGR